MAINNHVFGLLNKYCLGGKALAAGYPDILVDSNLLKELGPLPVDKHNRLIQALHKTKTTATDAKAVFNALGYDLDVIDIHKSRGCERIVDLNYPEYLGSYDLVIDHGTIEHCFNIGMAAINLATAVKLGGYMVQQSPLNMMNHGFYNLNPTWFYSFYESNGFGILHIDGLIGETAFELPKHQRFTIQENNATITMVAKKINMQVMGYPIQEKYKGTA